MEKKHDDGIKNISRKAIERTRNRIISEAGTKIIVQRAVKKDIENFEETLDINDPETIIQKPN